MSAYFHTFVSGTSTLSMFLIVWVRSFAVWSGALVTLCNLMPTFAATTNSALDPHVLVERMATAYEGITDYTALFLKRERPEKGPLPQVEKIHLRFQEPFKVHMTWETPNKGRVAIYINGENDNKILVNPGGIMRFMRLSLDPNSPMALGDGHHSILQAGIRNMIDMVMEQYRRARDKGDITVRLLGREAVDGRQAYHLDLEYPKSKEAGYYAYRAEIWIDEEYHLPTKMLVYTWDNALYAHYEYHRLTLNPGLGPEAFQLEPVSVPAQPDTNEDTHDSAG